MALRAIPLAARPLRAACILVSLFAVAGISHGSTGTTLATNGVDAKTAPPAAAAKQPAPSKLQWNELTPAQQQALAPLAGEWNSLEPERKLKWLAIGNKYASMNPDEQQRVQDRMREWLKLTPDERRIARESYSRAKKLNPDQKSEKWQEYQQLSEEQKKKLAADAAAKKPVATLPRPSQAATKPVPSIKSTPKPVLEESVTPKAAGKFPLQQPTEPVSK
ncbi:MAG TPA: DUF3106 domain-containing protein [Noviherbaspirillum sp.]|uniref:DUF3106 domain-containing protein n=1 Tax=Noviherbaspirillum sp. TaxID=1926288 RepID=UPI002DDD72BA|nr:DUF3106 domain-containing protein [Noviherbaspirillum sp.]HEV2612415.1 DUF3106 domain-containing protein [Noviherbaspirillum sp.]